MTYLLPGRVIHRFTTKDGKDAIIRYPRWEDLDHMLPYINALSSEDIYLTFSGEKITKEGEMYYLGETMKSIERGDMIYLACIIDNVLVGSCTIARDLQSRKRSYHIGIFGITIAKEFRKIGIGEILARVAIVEAKRVISGLKLLTLNVYSQNSPALKLYHKLGFMEAGKIPRSIWYKGKYIDEIKMYFPLEEKF